MSNLIPEATARALKDARQLAFEANQRTSQYADGINSLANENDGGIVDVAELAAENDGAVTDLADYVAELEAELKARIDALENK
jgi:hypothetical protein